MTDEVKTEQQQLDELAALTPEERTAVGELYAAGKEQEKGGDESPVEGNKEEPIKIQFDKTAVEQVEAFLLEAGLDTGKVATAVTENDGVTPEILAKLVEQHGESVANLIKDKLEGINDSFKATQKQQDQEIFDFVKEAFPEETIDDGEKIWSDLSGWAKSEASGISESERTEINGLLAGGGLGAKLAAQELVSAFKASPSFTQSPQLQEASGLSNEHGLKPLSRQEYGREMRKLEAQGHVYGQSYDMEQLDARRSLGMKRGR
tara:strand:+ start:971 stop:1759 length:789 start_codon:yes stop_codon:yes gene_type:complete